MGAHHADARHRLRVIRLPFLMSIVGSHDRMHRDVSVSARGAEGLGLRGLHGLGSASDPETPTRPDEGAPLRNRKPWTTTEKTPW